MSVQRSYNVVRADGSIETITVELDVDYLPPSLDADLSDRIECTSYRNHSAEEIGKYFNEYVRRALDRLYAPFVGEMEVELNAAIRASSALPARSPYDVAIDKSFEIGQALQSYLMHYGIGYVDRKHEQIEAKAKEGTG